MNPEDAIRRLRSEDRWVPMEPRFLPPAAAHGADAGGSRVRSRPGRLRAAAVTVVVLALLVAGTAAVLGGSHRPSPAVPATRTPAPTASAGTVEALPRVAGTVLATWTSESELPASGTFDAHGEAIAITLACTGGGSVQYTVVHHSDSSIGCTGSSTSGPELSSRNGRLIAEHEVTVRVAVTGHPRFALQVTAVPVTAVPTTDPTPTVAATGPAVPSSLRTCGARDLAPTATYERWPHFAGGVLTIGSAASSDCAIRSWPTLRYLDVSGAAIGGPAARDGDESSPMAPVRLAAHGTAFVQIELFPLDRLTECGAEQVRSLALGIGRATVHLPVPPVPAMGKCVDPHVQADGVGAVTAFKPSGP